MPARAPRRAVRRVATRANRPPRARAKTPRGANRRVTKLDVKVAEEKPVEIEEKPKPESWLDKLPPVIKPDEELHQRLLKERLEKHNKKVHQYCSLEAKGILEFVLRAIDIANEKDSEDLSGRKMRQLHSDFREGFLTPELETTDESNEPATLSTKLEPKFSLEVQNYLRFTSDSMWKDLSTFFSCQLDEEVVHDPDPKLNDFLEYLQKHMKLFQKPYHPFDKIKFPFTICIIGPIGTGRTTVCQLLQKVFDANIVEVVPQPPTDNLIRKKKSAAAIEPVQETEPPPEYPLKDSMTIKLTDDKSTISSIAQYICENNSRGTIVVGYPNTKSQLIMLEKAINQHNQMIQNGRSAVFEEGVKSSSVSPRSPPSGTTGQSSSSSSSKSKTPVLNIHGLIFTLNPNNSRERLIDPETGNVYQEDFLMPSFLDFYDVLPTDFLSKHDEILERLVRVNVPEIPNVTSKAISSMNSFESGCRKNYVTSVIPHCDEIDLMLNQIDLFIDALYKKNEKIIVERPLFHLAHPHELVKPGLCYNAILSWRKCLELFAPTIADQSNLVGIIGDRLNQMTDAAFDRFALYTFTADKRAHLCSEFQSKESTIQPQDTNNIPINSNNSVNSRLSANSNNSINSVNSHLPINSYNSVNSRLSAGTNNSINPVNSHLPINSTNSFNSRLSADTNNSTNSHLSIHLRNPSNSLNSSPSEHTRSSISLPHYSSISAAMYSSRLSFPHKPLATNISPPLMATAMTSRSPPAQITAQANASAIKSNLITKNVVTSKTSAILNNEPQQAPKKRPQTANSPALKALKVGKIDKPSAAALKKRPQTHQTHTKPAFNSRYKSRLSNTDSDSNAEELEREMIEKEENRNREFSNFFKVIWDLSLQSRDQNLKYVANVVEKSGLLELVVELRKTPKLIFVALILRLYYTRWFYDNFFELYTKDGNEEEEEEEEAVKRCTLLDDFKIDQIFPPKFDVQSRSLKYNDCMTQQSFSPKSISGIVEEKSAARRRSMDDLSSVDTDINEDENVSSNDQKQQNFIDDFLKKKNNDENQLKISKEEIYFNQDKTTSDFNIPPFQSALSFDDTLKFVDKFFSHYLKNLEDEKLTSNVKSSLHLFKTFSKSVKMKEVVLTEAITNLNHLVSDYAYTKCSHEMENFSEKFRKMRKNGFIEGNLFEYDFSGIRKENRHLADFSINYEMPIVVQSIVSFKSVKRIGEILANRNQKFCNIRSFLLVLKNAVGISPQEAAAIELCVKVFVCAECFSIKKLLLCFVHFPEEEEIISKMFPD